MGSRDGEHPYDTTVRYDPEDAPATATLIGRAKTAPGTLVVELTPTGRTLGWLAKCFFDGLGKQSGGEGTPRSEKLTWALVEGWLTALRIRRIVIWRAHHLRGILVDVVMDLAAHLDADIIFVAQPLECIKSLNRAFRRTAGLSVGTVGDLSADLGQPKCAALPVQAVRIPPGPSLASGLANLDFTLFRHACREQLSSTECAVVDAEYCGTAARSVSAFTTAEVVDEAWVLGWLRSEAAGASQGAITTRVRAAQAGAFVAGWLVNVELARLQECLVQDGDRPRWTPEIAARLEELCSPLLGALASVLGTAQCSFEKALQMTLADVTVLGLGVNFVVEGKSHHLDGRLALPLLAYSWWRQRVPGGDNSLWVSFSKGTPALTRNSARNRLAQVSALTGQPFSAFNRPPVKPRWRHRYGLTVRKLEPHERP